MEICVIREHTNRAMGLTLQDRDETGNTEGCAAMKDGLHVHVAARSLGTYAHSCVGLASRQCSQTAQYSAVESLRTASAGALFFRARLLALELYACGVNPRFLQGQALVVELAHTVTVSRRLDMY